MIDEPLGEMTMPEEIMHGFDPELFEGCKYHFNVRNDQLGEIR